MNTKKILKIFIIVFFFLTLYFIISGLRPRSGSDSLPEFEADGVGMTYSTFNKENKKGLEITSSESKREGKDKILMKNIKAEVYKKGKMDENIFIEADNGYVENNLNNFFIESNPIIWSENLEITSKNFLLKDRNVILNNNKTNYQIKTVKGLAEKGIKYNIKLDIISFFNTSGSYLREGQPFLYQTDMLRLYKNSEELKLINNNTIKGKNSTIKSDIIIIQFSDELETIKYTKTVGNSYFFTTLENNSQNTEPNYREIKAKLIQNMYDKQEKLEKSIIKGNAVITLKSNLNTTNINSNSLEIYYETTTGNILQVKLLVPSKIVNKGKTNFQISANLMTANFYKGEIDGCQSTGNCEFEIDDYKGNSENVNYNIKKNILNLEGKESKVFNKKNSFISKKFSIDTKEKILTSSDNIKTVIYSEKKNALFSTDTIFINSEIMKALNKENKLNYKNNVHLHQNDTVLKANELEIDDENNIKSAGNVLLSFRNNENEMVIRGDKIYFDSQKKIIQIKDKGIIKSKKNKLKANEIKIVFNEKNEIVNIYAEQKIEFVKEDITGNSEKANWLFNKDLIIFTKSAMIQKKTGGTTKGEKLRLDLKNNKVIILSERSKRTETIIE